MEMFDTIKLEIKCPYCNIIYEASIQTRSLENLLLVWRKGDHITNDPSIKYIDGITDCLKPKCKEYVKKQKGTTYLKKFGRVFYVRVLLEDGVVTGDYKILD